MNCCFIISQALKLDGIKSLLIRRDLLLDELSEMDSTPVSSEQKMLLSRKVCLTDPSLRFSLTDHTTMEETEDDIRERIEAVWGRRGKSSISYPEMHAETKKEAKISTESPPMENSLKSNTGWYILHGASSV